MIKIVINIGLLNIFGGAPSMPGWLGGMNLKRNNLLARRAAQLRTGLESQTNEFSFARVSLESGVRCGEKE